MQIKSSFSNLQINFKKITLASATFFGAAQEVRISHLYGGIHFTEGNLNGQILGQEIADPVWDKARSFILARLKRSLQICLVR